MTGQMTGQYRLSVTWVDQPKAVEVRIMQPSPQSSPMTLHRRVIL